MRRSGTDSTTVRDAKHKPRAGDEPAASLPDRFEPIAVIGRGGMGQVVRCHDRTLNRDVAVKIMDRLQTDRMRQRFLHEARAIGTLRHPNIVTVHDAAIGGEYLVMELIEGESLASRLHRIGRLPAEEVHRIGGELLAALATAHRGGIIHRDVKPANILLDGTGRVKLTDFGIASIADSELTHTGDVIGTPAYMAPEQLRGGRATKRADVYAAGATLFEVATGTRLFRDGRRVDDPIKAVLDATGDHALATAIGTAVREEEAERFASAEEFASALAHRARPRRRWLVASALVALGVLGFVVVRSMAGGGDRAGEPSARNVKIAVLPFEVRGADPRLDFASSGLPHLLGEQLSQIKSLEVLGYYRVSNRLADPAAPVAAWRDAARALGADVAVRGEITAGAGNVRLAIIIERSDGRMLDRIERDVPLDRVPATIQSLAFAVASTALGAPPSFAPSATRDFEIERELELGISAFERMDFQTARQHLNAAVARDDSLCDAYYYLALLDWWQQVSPRHHIEQALAGSLAPTRRDFLVGLGKLVDLQYPAGVDYFRDLARRAPDDRDVQYGLFEALYHGGDPTESIAVYRRLRELAPRFYVGVEHALDYYLERGDAAGIAWVREHWEPGSSDRSLLEARALIAQQHYADAVRVLERAVEEAPDAGVPVRRMLVEAYAVTGQLALAAEANERLAAVDPSYVALARFGLTVARGEDAPGQREQARHAVELGISGVKTWASRLDLLALDLPGGNARLLGEDVQGQQLTGRFVGIDVGFVIAARALQQRAVLEEARHSAFLQVAAVADALVAEDRKDRGAAVAAWRRSLALNGEGRMQLFGWYSIARNLRDAGDHAGVLAACDEVITPRVFTWAWASTVGPCLRWSAEAATALGREQDAGRRWRSLLALRSAAPATDELARAARAALGAIDRP